MRYILTFCLSLTLGLLSYSQKVVVSFNVTFTQPYCGGARPSPEMEAEFAKPKAFALKNIVLVSENGKKFSAKTNAQGVVKISLKPGNYKLYEVWRIRQKTYDGSDLKKFDKDCLLQEWKKEFAILKVDVKGGNYSETNGIQVPCYYAIPCLLDTYRPNLPE